MIDYRIYPHFKAAEFTCKCGCGRAEMDPATVAALSALRSQLAFPFPINSGFRCPDYNQQVSSTGAAGPHTTGKAIDVRAMGKRAFDIVSNAAARGFTGIGVAQKGAHGSRFIHLDTITDGPRPTVWTY